MPFAYFVRYWGGLSFRWFFPTLFSNSVPHSWRPTKVYCQMRETLRIMSTVGDVLQSSAGTSTGPFLMTWLVRSNPTTMRQGRKCGVSSTAGHSITAGVTCCGGSHTTPS
ncbi:hypothetical protein HOLleu_03895 [Holothuria leucospilota]|uniref:Uncharacterized protein n=1 Tax=Holothuria leucospilota TaxID=206669 RepID=A0A9Q1HHW6_HOLLE|nr:hypothetical protein HOLleu_03895 [Holothuria leucospilota]